jgi:hypothetical protein
MQLPNRENAYVPLPKLTEYLLSETHAVGRSKAKFFRSLGFNETNTAILEQQLLIIAHNQAIVEVTTSTHGTKYVVDGMIETPAGNSVRVRTIWIIEVGQDRSRFVTAYPA